jgi:hypothetical protein
MRDLPRRVCRQGRFIGFVLGVAALLAGCAAPSPTPGSAGAGLPPAALHDDDDPLAVPLPDEIASRATAPAPQVPQADGWHAVALPGKARTRYEATQKDGRAAWAAVSQRSASLWRKRMHVPASELSEVSFSWWVQDLPTQGSVAEAERADASARVVFAFHGDLSRLPTRHRVMAELAEMISGEKPPYATLMYVWDTGLPVGSVVPSPRSDRIRKIVVDSGPGQLRLWRDHRRNLVQDFRLAFGEEPGPLTGIALMTDSDNTRSQATSWYGEVQLHGPAKAAPPAGQPGR